MLSFWAQLSPELDGSSLAAFTLGLRSILIIQNGELVVGACELSFTFVQALGYCNELLQQFAIQE